MNDRFTPLDDDEVLHVEAGRILMSNPTFKVGELLDSLAQAISDREVDWSEDHEGWFTDGLECEALKMKGGGWQSGRVRIRIEFAPTCPPELLPEQASSRQRINLRAQTIDDLDEFDLP